MLRGLVSGLRSPVGITLGAVAAEYVGGKIEDLGAPEMLGRAGPWIGPAAVFVGGHLLRRHGRGFFSSMGTGFKVNSLFHALAVSGVLGQYGDFDLTSTPGRIY